MSDEVQQIQAEIFNRVILGLVLIGFVTATVSYALVGFSSPWFIRAVALLIVAVVAYGLRYLGRLLVASYVLVVELVGLVAEMFLHPSSITSFIPYLVIPVVIIAGFLLNPVATFSIAIISILLILLIVTLTGQLSSASLLVLLPPVVLTLIIAFLVAESKRYTNKLGALLFESQDLLKARTLEMMETRQRTDELTQQLNTLKNHQGQAKSRASQAQWLATQRDNRLFDLIKGTIQELNTSVEKLERVIEQLGEKITGQTDLLKTAWQRLDHLKALSINLDEIAQIEHGDIKLVYQQVDVGRLISEVVGTAQGLARGKDLQIRYQAPDDLPPLQADPTRLRQVLLHLLQNAIKYTDQGIIEIQAELNDKELMLFVSDTGIGMHREEAELVFEKFGRGSGTLAQRRQGAGLGLAICKRLIELHGGRMWVTSVLGIGSTFYLTLPVEVVREKTREAATLIDRELLATTEQLPQPVAALSQPPPDTNEDTLVMRPPSDVDATILSTPSPLRPVKHPSQPIHRYGPTYIRRFGLILLGLLLLVIVIVGALAIINPPTQPASATATQPALAVSRETSTPTLTPTVAPPPSATPSPTPMPTDTPAPPATDTPTAAPPPATPTATFTITPLPSATPGPSSTATPTAAPVNTVDTFAPPQISFISGQAAGLGIFNLGNIGNSAADNNRLSWSPSGQILFAREQNGKRDIYVTGQLLPLIASEGDDLQPIWSPDGRKIAFSSGRTGNFEIYVADADGGNLTQLTGSRGFDEWPAWSPDGAKITFVSDRDGNVELYVMNADGSNQQRLTNHPADDWPAAWSPDGRWLVFASLRDDNWNLYLVAAAGGSAQRLTNAPGNERDPVWSPDGSQIAFAYDGNGNWDIYTLPISPGNITEIPLSEWSQITNTPTDERYPVWPQ